MAELEIEGEAFVVIEAAVTLFVSERGGDEVLDSAFLVELVPAFLPLAVLFVNEFALDLFVADVELVGKTSVVLQ